MNKRLIKACVYLILYGSRIQTFLLVLVIKYPRLTWPFKISGELCAPAPTTIPVNLDRLAQATVTPPYRACSRPFRMNTCFSLRVVLTHRVLFFT